MIQKLTITRVRNIEQASLQPSAGINILYGDNGSGKTSVLEAIHLLGVARSFRTSRIKPVIQSGFEDCAVFARIARHAHEIPVGITRNLKEESFKIRVAGDTIRSTAELAHLLPFQLINPDSFRLLEGSPLGRRHYLDWGVFHVKHNHFFPIWKHFQKALKQRNSLLKHGRIHGSELAVWDAELVKAAVLIDQHRQAYIEKLKPVFNDVISELASLEDLTLQYYRGWDRDKDLSQVLQQNHRRDLQLGYTQAGPQRADLRIRISGANAADTLSRGQLKLVVCALKLAQGILYNAEQDQQCLFLVDDLPSELDAPNRNRLCGLFQRMKCQTFITCVEKDALSACWLPETEVRMFHVKHGQIELDETLAEYNVKTS